MDAGGAWGSAACWNVCSLVHILDSILLGSDLRIAIARVFVAALLGTVALNLTRLAADGNWKIACAAAVLSACGISCCPRV